MRSGTSKGPYFDRRDILKAVSNRGSIDILSKDEINVVTNVVGSGHPNQINGVGGGSSVTTKACIVMPNDDGTCRYWFLQCGTSTLTVDVSHGDCGNMIAGVVGTRFHISIDIEFINCIRRVVLQLKWG